MPLLLSRAKRWLYLIHRWFGIVICAFFAMWFVSGVVMMYVGYPKLTEQERLQHLPTLQAQSVRLTPAQAVDAAGMTGGLKDLRLAVAAGGRAVYLVEGAAPAAVAHTPGMAKARSKPITTVVDAETGAVAMAVDAAVALASAHAYATHGTAMPSPSPGAITYLGTIDEDAFTHTRSLDAHRPLHRVQLADDAHTLLYVSSRTGEVVRDAPRAERWWNYIGAWIHWLYAFRGTAFDPYWSDIVNWLSVVGIVVTLTGAVVGTLRWRFRSTYKSGSRSPYQGVMMRWHHITGLLFAVIALTWIFSGLMSMNPWRVFDNGAPALRQQAMDDGALQVAADAAPVAQLLAHAPGDIRELRWVRSAGQSVVLAARPDARPAVLDARNGLPVALEPAALRRAATRLLAAPIARIDVLPAYDLYYYDRAEHTMTGGRSKPLPVWRVVFDDRFATWVHIDPHTGAVLGRTDSARRTSRWLFAMLHSWDWLPLLERRPLWDIVLVALSLGGAVMSVTGVVIGWRRLGRKLRPQRTMTSKITSKNGILPNKRLGKQLLNK